MFVSSAIVRMRCRISWKFIWHATVISLTRARYGNDYNTSSSPDISGSCWCSREISRWLLTTQASCRAFLRLRVDDFPPFNRSSTNAKARHPHRLRSCRCRTCLQCRSLHWTSRLWPRPHISKRSLATWARASKAISASIAESCTRGSTD